MTTQRYLPKLIALILILLLFNMFTATISICQENEVVEYNTVNVRGRVTRVVEDISDQIEYSGGNYDNNMQILEVKIKSKGPYKNQIVQVDYAMSLDFSDKSDTSLKPGDEILLTLEVDNRGNIVQSYFFSIARDKYLLILGLIFAGVILLIGRMKGLRTLITLILTVLAIFYVLLPLILKGFDPVFISVWVCVAITGVTLLLVSGFNKKTLTALIGTSGGVIIAGLIAQVIGHLSKLTGLGSEESQMLLYIPQNISFDYKGLLFSGILIGALGASMDVGLSLSSAMFELKEHNPNMDKGSLLSAGMNIGRDMMATMSNTLILAYVGGSIQLLLVLMAYKFPFMELINMDGLASEIVRSLAGSIGLILTIPLTALAVILFGENHKKDEYHY